MSFPLRSFHPRILALLFCLLLLPACFALPPQVHHPLDALTPQEYWKAYHVLQDAGKIAEKTQFSSILLQEPAKSTVLAWKPGDPIDRKVDVVLLTEGKSYAAVIDISGETGKLDSWTELTNDQAPTSATENHRLRRRNQKGPPHSRRPQSAQSYRHAPGSLRRHPRRLRRPAGANPRPPHRLGRVQL